MASGVWYVRMAAKAGLGLNRAFSVFINVPATYSS
jgi:hypothetical protein